MSNKTFNRGQRQGSKMFNMSLAPSVNHINTLLKLLFMKLHEQWSQESFILPCLLKSCAPSSTGAMVGKSPCTKLIEKEV